MFYEEDYLHGIVPVSYTHLQQNTTDRNYLVAAARDGDENAIENLTLEDIDTYSMLSRRITHEDVPVSYTHLNYWS